MRSRSRLKLAITLVVLACLVAFVWGPLRRAWDLAALQAAVGHRHGWVTSDISKPPRHLPDFINRQMNRLFEFRFGPHFRRDYHYVRFRECIDGPLDNLHVISGEAPWEGDVGAAVMRFRRLKTVYIYAIDGPTEAQMTRFCEGLRTLPELETVTIMGRGVTDASIAPLAGHPSIRSLTFNYGLVTPRSASTFASLPYLRVLVIQSKTTGRNADEDRRILKAALPSCKTIDYYLEP